MTAKAASTPPLAPEMVRCTELTCAVTGFALGPLSFTVRRGDYLLLMGPSGAGKSMLLEILAGFRQSTSGLLHLRGQTASGVPSHARALGWVPQGPSLFPHLSVEKNLAYGLCARGASWAQARPQVLEWAERLGLTHLLHRTIGALSGGEQQRVVLARALLTGADLVLLDEPFSSLDPGQRRKLWAWTSQWHRELGITVVHVTHDAEHARDHGTHLAVLAQGQLLACGERHTTFADPRVGALLEL